MHRPRWGWKKLLLALALIGLGLGWLQDRVRQHRIVARFKDRPEIAFEYWTGNVSTVFLRGRSSDFGDADLAGLVGLRHLDALNLSYSQVSDAGLVHLKEFPNLQSLDVDCTPVTNAGLVRIKECPRLTVLSVLVTQITDEREQELTEAMPDLQIRKYHLIDGMRVGDGYQ